MNKSDPELAGWITLFEKIVKGDFPLLPNPEWSQDVAFVAFFIDGLMHRVSELSEYADTLGGFKEDDD